MALIRVFPIVGCIVAVVAASSGAGDSVSLVRRKDTGFRLLPGSPAPDAAVYPDLSLRLQLQDHPWLRWSPAQFSEGSVPYAGSTANWYDYFRYNASRGEDPNRKGNHRWIEGR
jgi:hypothetical protein